MSTHHTYSGTSRRLVLTGVKVSLEPADINEVWLWHRLSRQVFSTNTFTIAKASGPVRRTSSIVTVDTVSQAGAIPGRFRHTRHISV